MSCYNIIKSNFMEMRVIWLRRVRGIKREKGQKNRKSLLKAWNMIVPDVLAGKIFIIAICECFAVFIGSRGIIMLKEALKKE